MPGEEPRALLSSEVLWPESGYKQLPQHTVRNTEHNDVEGGSNHLEGCGTTSWVTPLRAGDHALPFRGSSVLDTILVKCCHWLGCRTMSFTPCINQPSRSRWGHGWCKKNVNLGLPLPGGCSGQWPCVHLFAKKTETSVGVPVSGNKFQHSPKIFFYSTTFYSDFLLQILEDRHLSRLLNVSADTTLGNSVI